MKYTTVFHIVIFGIRIEIVPFPTLDPPGPIENMYFMFGLVIIGSEMLGTVHFDQNECFVDFIAQ